MLTDGSRALFLVALLATAPVAAADKVVGGAVDVAVPVDVLVGDGLGAAVVTDVAAGVFVEGFDVFVRVPVVARIDEPRIDLGNVLVSGGVFVDGGRAAVTVVLPTLWPAVPGGQAQAEALVLAAAGFGFSDAARFVPAAAGLVVSGELDFGDVQMGGALGGLGPLAGGPVFVPLGFSVRGAPRDENPSFYLGARTGSVVNTSDPLGSALSATGEMGLVLSLDVVAIDAGINAGVFSSRDVSFGAVVMPRVVVRFGFDPSDI